MKTTQKFIFLALLGGIALSGCNGTEKTEKAENEENTAPVEEVTFVNEKGVLQLNGEEKWTANAETTDGVNNMMDQIVAFNNIEVPDEISSYNLLGTGIKHSMDEIFNKCTMKGASHDELHDFLVPILGYIKTLNGEDLEAAKNVVPEFLTYLEKYDGFFV